MTQTQQNKNAGSPTIDSKRESRLGHWVRVVVMFLSWGFIFPHAMTEDEDIAKVHPDKDASVKKQ